ncbi:hypothetical protein SXCC_00752 [Gluconacetobacter sp. SXCC-1]|nr:hypothetical protein SXCC_00752 [Gluconacetobacter sp. SXCC-1]
MAVTDIVPAHLTDTTTKGVHPMSPLQSSCALPEAATSRNGREGICLDHDQSLQQWILA